MYLQKAGKDKINVGIRSPYLRVIGIEVDSKGPGRASAASTDQVTDMDDFQALAANPNIYEIISKSVAPAIFGSSDIKKAIACLLFGGSRKRSDFRLKTLFELPVKLAF